MNQKTVPPAGARVVADRAAVGFDEALGEGEPDPARALRAGGGAAGSVERLEHPVAHLGRGCRARVGHLEPEDAVAGGADTEADEPSTGVVLDRVRQQVQQHLADAARIGAAGREVSGTSTSSVSSARAASAEASTVTLPTTVATSAVTTCSSIPAACERERSRISFTRSSNSFQRRGSSPRTPRATPESRGRMPDQPACPAWLSTAKIGVRNSWLTTANSSSRAAVASTSSALSRCSSSVRAADPLFELRVAGLQLLCHHVEPSASSARSSPGPPEPARRDGRDRSHGSTRRAGAPVTGSGRRQQHADRGHGGHRRADHDGEPYRRAARRRDEVTAREGEHEEPFALVSQRQCGHHKPGILAGDRRSAGARRSRPRPRSRRRRRPRAVPRGRTAQLPPAARARRLRESAGVNCGHRGAGEGIASDRPALTRDRRADRGPRPACLSPPASIVPARASVTGAGALPAAPVAFVEPPIGPRAISTAKSGSMPSRKPVDLLASADCRRERRGRGAASTPRRRPRPYLRRWRPPAPCRAVSSSVSRWRPAQDGSLFERGAEVSSARWSR